MVSLWGSNNKDDNHKNQDPDNHSGEDDNMARSSEDGTDGRQPPSRREYERREATERDRLLPSNPRPPHSDGYLDPDDPAVSFNLPRPVSQQLTVTTRSPHTTSGRSASSATLPSSSSSSPSYGGRCSSLASSSAHQACTRVVPASSTSPTPH